MKAIICEMCQSNDLVKQNGLYVCQHCGTRYSAEETHKLFVEGPIKIDYSDEIENLYELARRSRDDGNSENAKKYYEMILLREPNSWEATFYSAYYEAAFCSVGEIQSAVVKLTNCEDTVLQLVKENVKDAEMQEMVVKVIAERLIILSSAYFQATQSRCFVGKSVEEKFFYEFLFNTRATRDMLYLFGDLLIDFFGDTYGNIAARCWKTGIEQHVTIIPTLRDEVPEETLLYRYANKVQIYDTDYMAPEVKQKGCYVATAVYGSYDCPQVWTLRRFRDYNLAESWHGRVFIRAYYAISPTFVKWFGQMVWFKKLCKPALDRMVKKLNRRGVEDTPYYDRLW